MKVLIYNAAVNSWGKPLEVDNLERFAEANRQQHLELYKVVPLRKETERSK